MSWTRCSCAENNRMAPSTTRIAFASFIGTAIEFYDFYIYGLAVAMVIGPVFFPGGDPAAQALNAFLTFGIAFLARPFGALLFGHFGDRIGRKTTLVASLLCPAPPIANWQAAAPSPTDIWIPHPPGSDPWSAQVH